MASLQLFTMLVHVQCSCISANATHVPVLGVGGTLRVDVRGGAPIALPLFDGPVRVGKQRNSSSGGGGLLWGGRAEEEEEEHAHSATVAFVNGYLRGFDALVLSLVLQML